MACTAIGSLFYVCTHVYEPPRHDPLRVNISSPPPPQPCSYHFIYKTDDGTIVFQCLSVSFQLCAFHRRTNSILDRAFDFSCYVSVPTNHAMNTNKHTFTRVISCLDFTFFPTMLLWIDCEQVFLYVFKVGVQYFQSLPPSR